MRTLGLVLAILLLGAGTLRATASAAEEPTANLTIKDHRFEPAELILPAGTKVKIIVKNLDPTPEEFESIELRREKIVPGGGEVAVYVGPLKPGSYKFFGDFHQDTAKGVIVVK
ncbi:MAG: cupredoxin domain-containing protein [Alphaproteobacteria bacterium]